MSTGTTDAGSSEDTGPEDAEREDAGPEDAGPEDAGAARCAGHGGVSAELRALAHAVLGRLEPALDRLRDRPPGPTPAADPTCAVCPVCVLVGVLRGERPELVRRLSEHLDGVVALVRDALAEPDPAPAAPSAPSGPSGPSAPSGPSGRTASGGPKRVQRIPVERVGTRPRGATA